MTPDAIHGYFEAINAERWDDLRHVFTDDAAVIAVGAPPRRGHDEITAHYGRLFRAFGEHRDTPRRVLPCGDVVTVEVRFDGTTPDGRKVSFDAVDVFDLRDERIERLTNWYDLVYVRRVIAGEAP